MYDLIFDISQRPTPFSRYTARELWTRPHLAEQMLGFHLNPETDLASRRFDLIDQVVSWIDLQLQLSGNKLCDLGCGPGLYSERFAALGANVTGIDFSVTSLEYAKQNSVNNVSYLQADYLIDDLPDHFDIVTLIYTDLCALSPQQRGLLLGKINSMLKPGGHIILDVVSEYLMKDKVDSCLIENNLMGGFWSATEYVGIQKSFVYPDDNLTLDRYIIFEPDDIWQIFNWTQYFSLKSIETELKAAGFILREVVGDLTGTVFCNESSFIGLIATKA
jgi:SAM-dependent methyltransferase